MAGTCFDTNGTRRLTGSEYNVREHEIMKFKEEGCTSSTSEDVLQKMAWEIEGIKLIDAISCCTVTK